MRRKWFVSRGRKRIANEALSQLSTPTAFVIFTRRQKILQEKTQGHDDVEAKIRREEASFDCGPLLWLSRYTKTENAQYEAQGLPFLAPFPAKEYFVHLFSAFLKR